ncbi:thioesterase II family protein [Streptomyces sp. NPDC058611]|uniref:thioesterase II family protein n=1 Tax=unclassified Streptomyces TaxID=2593676 RepID=UPI003648A8F0
MATTLICLPFAGAGASFFRGWRAAAPSGLNVLPVQLPGREERIAEDAHRDVGKAVDEVCEQLLREIDGEQQVAVFGHSLGAVLAYELAHRFTSSDGPQIVHLFASGSPAPENGREQHATGLSDEEFVAQVARFAGYSHPALDNDDMRSVLLPTLRADVEMHETYRPGSDAKLTIPVTTVRGQDDELVDASETAAWAGTTTGRFSSLELTGGHMYLVDQVRPLLRGIAGQLQKTGLG